MNQIAVAKSIYFLFADEMVEIPIISQTATYTCKIKESSQGRVFDHELGFKVAGINTQICELIEKMQMTSTFLINDVNGIRQTMQRKELNFKFSIERVTAATFGSFRGFDVNVKLTSLFPASLSPL